MEQRDTEGRTWEPGVMVGSGAGALHVTLPQAPLSPFGDRIVPCASLLALRSWDQ